MSEFTITVTENNGVVAIALASKGDSRPLADLVAKALTGVLPMIVTKAARKVAGQDECNCPVCEQERAAQAGGHTGPSRTLH